MSAITQHQRHTTEWFVSACFVGAFREVPEYTYSMGVDTSAAMWIFDQASKGVWWMPWHQEAMKDVVTCDKPRLAG